MRAVLTVLGATVVLGALLLPLLPRLLPFDIQITLPAATLQVGLLLGLLVGLGLWKAHRR